MKRRRLVLPALVAAGVIVAGIVAAGVWAVPRTVSLTRWEYVKAEAPPEGVRWLSMQVEPATLVKDAAWQTEPPEVDDRWCRYVARTEFQHKKTDGPSYYELSANWPEHTQGRVWLNGQELTGPCEGLLYRVFPGIDPSRFHAGRNVLTVAAELYTDDLDAAMEAGERVKHLSMSLRPQAASDLDMPLGPIWGWFDRKTCTVSALANMPAEWSVTLDTPGFSVTPLRRQPGFCQTFEISRPVPDAQPLPAPTRVSCTLRARLPGQTRWQVKRSGEVTVGPLGRQWSFVVLGDNRTQAQRWKRVIGAAGRRNPRFIVHTGDFVSDGRDFQRWIEEFWKPAEHELSTIPLYGVMGNHEDDSALFDRILALPGTRDCWVQDQGDLLMIGIDGARDWSAASELYRKLETRLQQSRAKFILIFSHYPALSSSRHSKLNEQGEYMELDMRRAHKYLLPLCVQYHVTAFVAGHEHCYERSEFQGVTAITAGGAGAPTYRQSREAQKRNPYSKVYYAGLNYLLLTVTPDELRMEALTPEGQVLDKRVWTPRPPTP